MFHVGKFLGVLIICSVLMTGCYRSQYVIETEVSNGETHRSGSHHFVYGLVNPGEPVDIAQFEQQCPNGVAYITVKQSFLDGVIGWVAGFRFLEIYRPTTVVAACK